MGFVEVLRNVRTIFAQIDRCKADIKQWQPDVVILIDYAGFNLRIARFAKEIGIPTYYYIAPKVWAWKEGRVKKIRRYVDQLFVIFPFEVAYFRRHGIEAIYEGNPLVDALAQRTAAHATPEAFRAAHGLDERPIVALLAGSRRSEVRHNLPTMARMAELFPSHQFVVAGVPWLDRSLYEPYLSEQVRWVCDVTYELLSQSEAAVVTSGTATLETALLGTPQLVCYRTDFLSSVIGKAVLNIPYISLVNLVLDREAVRELLQEQMNLKNASAELRAILPGGERLSQQQADYQELRERIGAVGASARFARRMVELLKRKA